MTRLIIVVEGQTEESFVNEVLAPNLNALAVYTSATIVGKSIAERRGHRGRGGGHFRHWRRDLERILAGDTSRELRVTTLFDLYGLPNDFPGLDVHAGDLDTNRRCNALTATLAAEFGDPRFLPYIQRHEFEALVLASLPSLRDVLDADDDRAGLEQLIVDLDGIPPEDVNDGEVTAPSKRLLARIPGYSKTLHGPLATEDTGLIALRATCPRFDAWVSTLEALAVAA